MYSTLQINNNIRKMLEEGKSNDDALDFYLKMNMQNDLGPEQAFITKVPTPAEVRIHLLGNDTIDKDDIKLEMTKSANSNAQRLVVRLSPTCTLYAEQAYSSLQVTINEKNISLKNTSKVGMQSWRWPARRVKSTAWHSSPSGPYSPKP